MKYLAVIPSRLDSSRFPRKPMKKILGMPMIGHCYLRTKLAEGLEEVFVATCDDEIAEYIKSIGGKAIMTSNTHTRASTRTAEALQIIEKDLEEKIDIVVMVQGDEPLISPEAISQTLGHFSDPQVSIVNIVSRITTKKAFEDTNNVKVVVDKDFNALYFSREPIPSGWQGWKDIPKYMQTGVIAFRREALLHFNNLQESNLEKIESVDMNRVLEEGEKIRMVITEHFTLGVDVPEELKQAEKILMEDLTAKEYLS